MAIFEYGLNLDVFRKLKIILMVFPYDIDVKNIFEFCDNYIIEVITLFVLLCLKAKSDKIRIKRKRCNIEKICDLKIDLMLNSF